MPDDAKLPPKNEFEEVILINSGIVCESMKAKLTAMAEFNVELLERCFGTARN